MDLACVRALVKRLDRRDNGTAGAGGGTDGGADIEYVLLLRVDSVSRIYIYAAVLAETAVDNVWLSVNNVKYVEQLADPHSPA